MGATGSAIVQALPQVCVADPLDRTDRPELAGVTDTISRACQLGAKLLDATHLFRRELHLIGPPEAKAAS
jgi:hypothetical protein